MLMLNPRNPAVKRLLKKANADDARIDRAFNTTCQGLQIPIMKLGEIFKVGRAAIAAGANDAQLGEQIRAFVETLVSP